MFKEVTFLTFNLHKEKHNSRGNCCGESNIHPSLTINFIESSLVISKVLQSSIQFVPRICQHVLVHCCNYLSGPCGEVINVNYGCLKTQSFT